MLCSFFLPFFSRPNSVRCGCSSLSGCSSRSSTDTVFRKVARSAVPAPAAATVLLHTGGGSGDQKSRCKEPGVRNQRCADVTGHHVNNLSQHTHAHTRIASRHTRMNRYSKGCVSRRFSLGKLILHFWGAISIFFFVANL